MHLDRLQQELLDGYRNPVDESQKKKQQSKSNINEKKSDHYGL